MKHAFWAAALLNAAAANAAIPELPLRANDLAPGERWEADNHGGGIQDHAKDVVLWRHVSGTTWSELKADAKDGAVATNWLSFGRPVYALASGTVIACWRNAPDNVPGSYHAQYLAKKYAGGGNHLWVKNDDGTIALYAHFKSGSMPKALCPHDAALFKGTNDKGGQPDIEPEAMVLNGARVNVGQKIGEVGNSGASKQKPHLHFHIEKANAPVVMAFARGTWTDFANKQGNLTGPWTRLDNKAMPEKKILFWPPYGVGSYTWNGTTDDDYQQLFDQMKDSGMMPTLITCADNGATYNSKWSQTSGLWALYHGMTASEAAAKQTL